MDVLRPVHGYISHDLKVLQARKKLPPGTGSASPATLVAGFPNRHRDATKGKESV